MGFRAHDLRGEVNASLVRQLPAESRALQRSPKGNCIDVELGDTQVLYDASVSGKRAKARMAKHGRCPRRDADYGPASADPRRPNSVGHGVDSGSPPRSFSRGIGSLHLRDCTSTRHGAGPAYSPDSINHMKCSTLRRCRASFLFLHCLPAGTDLCRPSSEIWPMAALQRCPSMNTAGRLAGSSWLPRLSLLHPSSVKS